MGCVYSYPLFSFQGSICFSAAKIILSNLHLFVKHFFHFLFSRSFTDISHQQKLLYQVHTSLSMFFFKNFFSFLCFLRFDFSVCPAVFAGTFIYYTRMTKNVNTFFHFFSFSFQTLDFSAFSPIPPPLFPCFFHIMQQNSQKQNPNGMPSGFFSVYSVLTPQPSPSAPVFFPPSWKRKVCMPRPR